MLQELLHVERSPWNLKIPSNLKPVCFCCKACCALVFSWVFFLIFAYLINLSNGWETFIPDTSGYKFDWSTDFSSVPTLFENRTRTQAWPVRMDFHSHTVYSDGRLTPEQALQWHKANNFNVIAVTDHNTLSGGLESRKLVKDADDIIVIAGVEWSHCRGHYNILLPMHDNKLQYLGFSNGALDFVYDSTSYSLPVSQKAYPTNDDFKLIFDNVHKLHGIVIANHRPWDAWNFDRSRLPSMNDLLAWDVDYLEAVNQYTYDHPSSVFARMHGIGTIAGSDMHFAQQRTYAWTVFDVSNFTEDAIWDVLRSHRLSLDVVFDAKGSEAIPDRSYNKPKRRGRVMYPLNAINDLIFNTLIHEDSEYAYSFQVDNCGSENVEFDGELAFYGIMWWGTLQTMTAVLVILCLCGWYCFRKHMCNKRKNSAVFEESEVTEMNHS